LISEARFRQLMDQFVEPLGVNSNKNPPSIGSSRVENLTVAARVTPLNAGELTPATRNG
jgi:hypothetical protein